MCIRCGEQSTVCATYVTKFSVLSREWCEGREEELRGLVRHSIMLAVPGHAPAVEPRTRYLLGQRQDLLKPRSGHLSVVGTVED